MKFMKHKKIIIHIPARAGSVRVPKKNIRLMAGKPMISYAIEQSLLSEISDDVYVNTNDEEIKKYVTKTYPNIKIYHRNEYLSSDKATSDEFNFDIIDALDPDILVMVSPTCPLIQAKTIREAFQNFLNLNVDTLITCNETKMQAFVNDTPINIRLNEALQPSQNNESIKILNWAVTIWDARKFKSNFQTLGYASLGSNRSLMTISDLQSYKVSNQNDFEICESIIKFSS